jgi:uncharacterized membrane protein YphA (DoxX/SURF4 family)
MRLPGTILQGILARSALTFLRVFLGGAYLFSAWNQIGGSAGYFPGDSLAVIQWGETLVGAALILGLLTRLAAAGAFALAVYPLVADRLAFGLIWRAETAWACIALALMVGAAGRTLGLDGLLAKRWIRSPFW